MQVSVIIPTYNRAALFREALESVLNQTHRDLQVIVVNDGSTDGTAEVLTKYADRIQTIHLNRAGIAKARNAGIEAATGEFIAFLDDDDLWEPTKLEKQLAYAVNHPNVSVIYTDAIEFNSDGPSKNSFFDNFPTLRDPSNLFAPMIVNRAIPLPSTIMVKTELLRQTGLRFSEAYNGVEDLALYLDALRSGATFGCVPERLIIRRLHASNISGNHCRRCEIRKRLYRDLLHRPLGTYNRSQTSNLKAGLRDARYRVGECRWEELRLREARLEFLHALPLNGRTRRGVVYLLCTMLPARAIRTVRSAKHRKNALRAT